MKSINWNETKILINNESDLSDMPGELPVCKWLYATGCTGLTSLPELPVCKTFDASGCTGLTSLPELPVCKWLYATGCTGLTSLPELPVCDTLYATGCTGLTSLPALPVCNSLYASGCTGLTSLPELPVCKWLNATGCTLNAPEGTPVIKNIDAAILGCIEQGGCLDMGDWHTCETTHCRAGWAIHLACDAGRELEEKTCASIAGTLIYAASRPGVPIPDFYATNKEAMADMKRCADMDKQSN